MSLSHETQHLSGLRDHVDLLHAWLEDRALPLWFDQGRDTVNGGAFERLDHYGTPLPGDKRRARVAPRQIYSFAAGGSRGLMRYQDWQAACLSDLEAFEATFRCRSGLFGNQASSRAALTDASFDLYNQAFALFAYASMAQALPDFKGELETKARELLRLLNQTYKHPVAGFVEGVPHFRPLRSNPHMHLLEACLAWEKAAIQPAVWAGLADEIAGLALTHFIDQDTGALREYFDQDWNAMTGDLAIVEPGHQFEWAWLLWRWADRRGHRRGQTAAKRLFDVGSRYGICPRRDVAIMALNAKLEVKDPIARLWPQTEWLKAACILARNSTGQEQDRYILEAKRACRALQGYLLTDIQGLWFDKMKPSGDYVDEPAPASSFYHIVCAILEAFDTVDKSLLTRARSDLLHA